MQNLISFLMVLINSQKIEIWKLFYHSSKLSVHPTIICAWQVTIRALCPGSSVINGAKLMLVTDVGDDIGDKFNLIQ